MRLSAEKEVSAIFPWDTPEDLLHIIMQSLSSSEWMTRCSSTLSSTDDALIFAFNLHQLLISLFLLALHRLLLTSNPDIIIPHANSLWLTCFAFDLLRHSFCALATCFHPWCYHLPCLHFSIPPLCPLPCATHFQSQHYHLICPLFAWPASPSIFLATASPFILLSHCLMATCIYATLCPQRFLGYWKW